MSDHDHPSPAVGKAIRLLELLCESDAPLGVAEIARQLGTNTNMVYRLLKTLEGVGWVVKGDSSPKYNMSLRAFHFTSKPVSRMNVVKAAELPLRELWHDTGECTHLSILDDDKVLFLLVHEPVRGDVRITTVIGGRYELHTAAPGKVLLAHTDKEYQESVIGGKLKRYTENTICSAEKLRRELQNVRRKGLAVDREEGSRGLICLGAPVFDHDGNAVAAVGTSVLTMNWSVRQMVDQLGPKVRDTAREISAILGHETEGETT